MGQRISSGLKTHCLIENPKSLDFKRVSLLCAKADFDLNEHNISRGDFACIPDLPSDCIEGEVICPYFDLGREDFKDETGWHWFWAWRLKPSMVSLFANLTADRIEPFCRRWSTDNNYAPFQGWQHVSPQVARQTCLERAFNKLHPFTRFFGPLCQTAIAADKGIFCVEESHEFYVSEKAPAGAEVR